MDQGLIATIGAIVGGTIPLGALTFTLIRWIDGRHRKDMAVLREEMAVLREEMKAGEGRLDARIERTEGRLRDEMKATEGRLEARIDSVRDDVKATEGRLRDEVKATEKRLDARIGGLEADVRDVGDRLSRVEGVIEGALLTTRAPVAESREGAA